MPNIATQLPHGLVECLGCESSAQMSNDSTDSVRLSATGDCCTSNRA